MEEHRRSTPCLPASLAQRNAPDRGSVLIARRVVSACLAIDAALAPIVGKRGVAELLKRAVLMASRSRPWLAASLPLGVQSDVDLQRLEEVLCEQPGEAAAAAGESVLTGSKELLTSLVGQSLADRLLRTVWIDFFLATPEQDPIS